MRIVGLSEGQNVFDGVAPFEMEQRFGGGGGRIMQHRMTLRAELCPMGSRAASSPAAN